MPRLVDVFVTVLLASCLACADASLPRGGETPAVSILHLLPHAQLSTELERSLRAALARPDDFSITAGSWRRQADEVHDTAPLSGDAEICALVRATPAIADADLSAEVRLSADARVPSSAGILLRMRDGSNGLGVALEEGEGIRLLAIREGRARTLATTKVIVERDRWYTLGVSMSADRVVASLDGRALLDVTLPEAALSGGIGLFRGRGERVAFRHLQVGAGDRTEPVDVAFTDIPAAIAPLLSSSSNHSTSPPSQPWEFLVQAIELNDDFRKSVVIPPDSEIRVPLALPRRPLLHLDLGVLATSLADAGASSRLRIGFQDASRTTRWLSTHQVSAQAHWRSWQPQTLNLGDFDGERGLLILRNESIGPGGSFVALANPLLRSGAAVVAAARPNLLLVTIDTLRADHLGMYGYARETSPFLDSLAARSVVFDDVTAQSSWTKSSMASMFTSTYPELNGVRGADHLLPLDIVTLAEVLEREGYFTVGIQTNPWLLPRSRISRGFAEYQWLQPAPPAARVNERAVEVLNRRPDAPFFLYLHYMDVHHPYMPPASYLRFGSRPEDAYDGEIRYLDDQLAGLHQTLAEKGLLENTLIVVTSDHGEEFGDHGGRFHGGTLYHEQLNVPLMLNWQSRLPAGLRVAGPMQNLDIAPTILELLGAALPPGFQGISRKRQLLSGEAPANDEAAVFAQTGLNDVAPDSDLISVSVGRWKFIKDRKSAWSRLFDRSLDRTEQRDLSALNPQMRIDLERRCDEFVAGNQSGRFANDTATPDPAVLEQLRSLGYLMNTPAPPPARPPERTGVQ